MSITKRSTSRARVLASSLYATGVPFTVQEAQIECGGEIPAIRSALHQMAEDCTLRRVGKTKFQKRQPHWIHTGTLAGGNVVRRPA